MLIPAKAFAKQSLQRITFYRCWYLLPGNRKSEAGIGPAWTRSPLFRNQDCNTGVAAADIILKYLLKVECAG